MLLDVFVVKLVGIWVLGVEIVLYDCVIESCEEIVVVLVVECGVMLVLSFDDFWVIEG